MSIFRNQQLGLLHGPAFLYDAQNAYNFDNLVGTENISFPRGLNLGAPPTIVQADSYVRSSDVGGGRQL